jgi:hypothetical protein
MLKTIPKSNITKRKFQVYKLWNADQTEYPAIAVNGNDPLYRSIKTKYYSQLDGNVINLFGVVENPATISKERQLSDTIYVIDVDRDKLGEQLKKGSIKITDSSNTVYIDNGWGKLVNPVPTYNLINLDLENEILTIEQDGIQYEISITNIFDLITGSAILTLNGDTDSAYIVSIDFEESLIRFEKQLNFEGIGLQALAYGNVFYSDGVIVFTADVDLSTYTLEYRSTQTIYETEVLITARAGEFNYSQNPSAVDVIVSGSYNFETTTITNVSPSKNVKIKEITDISRKEQYSGSVGTSIGGWDDYFTSASIDPTGSYLAPYITTIGIFDDDGDMVAIAKLPKPIKNLPDYDINFLIRFDT